MLKLQSSTTVLGGTDGLLNLTSCVRPSVQARVQNVVAAHIVFARGLCDDDSLKFDDERIKASRYKLLSDLAEIVEENRKRNVKFEQRPRMTSTVSFSQCAEEGDPTASNMRTTINTNNGSSDESPHVAKAVKGVVRKDLLVGANDLLRECVLDPVEGKTRWPLSRALHIKSRMLSFASTCNIVWL